MVRTIGLLLGILFVASLPASAQDKVEVFGGYSYMRFRPSPDVNLNGWELGSRCIRSCSDHRCRCLRRYRRLRTCCWAGRISARGDSGIRRLQWQSEEEWTLKSSRESAGGSFRGTIC